MNLKRVRTGVKKGDPKRGTTKESIRCRSAATEKSFIVGIGASAGGLEAFTELLQHLPEKTGMGFVLVQHLMPEHKSILPQLLAKATRLPVLEAKNNVRVEPDHIYVIPPNASLTISGGILKIGPRQQKRGALRSIDAFFDSLAKDQKECAIGVVLSGTDFDGSAGVESIKAEGGITFAQDKKRRGSTACRATRS